MAKIKYNDVPFVPSADCTHYEDCQADAYNQALEDVLRVVEWDGYTLDIKERIEQLKK